jgi:hypothetical protein
MRMIVHAGTHKTGTTSIQSALAENRAWLHEHAHVFPVLGAVAHNEFAHGLARAKSQEVESYRAAIMSVAEPERTLILSAEEFSTQLVGSKQWQFDEKEYWQGRSDYLERLRTVLRDFDNITIFVCFRRHDAFAQSLYTTNILTDRYRWSFAEFRERCAPLFDYRRQVEMFREVFADVRLISFETIRHNLLPEFCRWIGIPVLPKTLREPKRVSPDARLIYWLYRRGSNDVASTEPETFKLMTSFVGSNAATSILPEAPSSLWESGHDWQDFIVGCTEPEPGFFPLYQAPPPSIEIVEDELASIDKAFNCWRLRPRKQKRWAQNPHASFSLRNAT